MGGRKMDEQNFTNHVRFVPPFHFFAVPVLAVNLFWSLYRLWKLGFSFATIFGVIFAAALAIAILEARVFSLAGQDPVIPFGERPRFAQVLPPGLHARNREPALAQNVSLRGACESGMSGLSPKIF